MRDTESETTWRAHADDDVTCGRLVATIEQVSGTMGRE